jgi:hypothetical protein
VAPLSPWDDQRLHVFPSIVPFATLLADRINSCGEPPDVAASVVGAQFAGPSYPTLADCDDVVTVTLRTSLTARTFTVDGESASPPTREKPKPTSDAKMVVATRNRTRPRVPGERRVR